MTSQSLEANKHVCLSATALQPWPQNVRRGDVAIANANINLGIKRRMQ